jgi:hypothetical protein
MKEAVETAAFLGAYQSPALAEHDGLCWLFGKQEDMGFSDEGYNRIELHGRRYEGCFLYRTPRTLAYKIKGLVWTWTEQNLQKLGAIGTKCLSKGKPIRMKKGAFS